MSYFVKYSLKEAAKRDIGNKGNQIPDASFFPVISVMIKAGG
ncbi:hypothetical protein [Photorhabdus khanii]